MNAKCYEWDDAIVTAMKENWKQTCRLTEEELARFNLARMNGDLFILNGDGAWYGTGAWYPPEGAGPLMENATYRLRPDFALEWPVYVAHGKAVRIAVDGRSDTELLLDADGDTYDGLDPTRSGVRELFELGYHIIPTAEAEKRIAAAKGPKASVTVASPSWPADYQDQVEQLAKECDLGCIGSSTTIEDIRAVMIDFACGLPELIEAAKGPEQQARDVEMKAMCEWVSSLEESHPALQLPVKVLAPIWIAASDSAKGGE